MCLVYVYLGPLQGKEMKGTLELAVPIYTDPSHSLPPAPSLSEHQSRLREYEQNYMNNSQAPEWKLQTSVQFIDDTKLSVQACWLDQTSIAGKQSHLFADTQQIVEEHSP